MIRWLAACGVLIVSTISAAEPRHRLIWHAPAGCPDEAALREAIERRLEMSLDAVELAIDVEVVATARGFEARIAHGASDETRTLDSASCDELTDAVSVVIARLATEARAAAVTPPPVPPPVPPPPPRARVETPVRIAPPSTVWNAGLRISGIAGTGGAPGIDAGGELAGSVSCHAATLELAGARWATKTALLAGSTMSGVDVRLQAVAVRAGWWPTDHAVRAWVTGEVGTASGAGVGLGSPHGGSGRWIAGGAGLGWGVRVTSRLRAVASSDVEIVFDRVGFALDSGGVLYQTPSIALELGLGLELRLR